MLAAATLAAVLFCSLPFWTGPWLGMIDYPNHLARYFMVAHYAQFPALHEFYRVEWHFIPNIGLDLAVQAVHAATSLPTERVSQGLVGALSVSLIPAVLLLNRALFGAWSYWPLASALPVYNNALLYGFTNYIGGLTLAIFLAAAWVAFRARTLVLVLPAFALGATTLFFFHLYALAVYGLFWLCYEMYSLWTSRGPPSPARRPPRCSSCRPSWCWPCSARPPAPLASAKSSHRRSRTSWSGSSASSTSAFRSSRPPPSSLSGR